MIALAIAGTKEFIITNFIQIIFERNRDIGINALLVFTHAYISQLYN